LSNIDNTIRFVLLKLNGFKDYYDGYVLTPSGHLVKEEHFVKSVRVIAKEPIVYGNGYLVKENTRLKTELVFPKDTLFNHGNFISSVGTIYLLIRLAKMPNSEYNSFDGYFGVDPKFLDGMNPNDLFEISWDELGAYTIEEYEKMKAEEAKRKAELKRKAEEERKRKIAEEERKIKEQRKRTENAILRMKNYNFKLPTFPNTPILKTNGSISSFEMITDSVNLYFDSLDKSLRIIEEDLDAIGNLGRIKYIASY
jgi:hypothetical protein